jgi:hypothetical protein
VPAKRRPGWVRCGLAVAARPALWPTAVRQTRRLARRGWWSQAPFLPLPGRAYLAFRLEVQYGDPTARPVPADVVGYLRWCRAQDQLRARAAPGGPGSGR